MVSLQPPTDAYAKVFRRRLGVLVALLSLVVSAGIWLAVFVQRDTTRTLRRLASVELEAAMLARQFRSDVHDLQNALLRIGSGNAKNGGAIVQQRRQRLNEWLRARFAAAGSEDERKMLLQLGTEMRAYFTQLDVLSQRTGGFEIPLDRDTVVICDEGADRLQGMADDFSAAHDKTLRDLLQESLSSVVWLRNLVLVCLALLVATMGIVVAMIYRDVVRPLRAQLVDSKSLLVKREKLAALGTLAAGVAHEIRNPLTAIKARLYTLRSMLSTNDGIADVQAIAEEVDRLDRIVRDVLGYAQPGKPEIGEVELGTWLREFATFVEPEILERKIEFSVKVAETVRVHADASQLRQIMLNLVRNAKEALAGRPGHIELTLHRERSRLLGRPANVAVLAVTDSGPGIPNEIRARLFDPFFTTKAAGTGLGLSIVARLVENQGGEIAFQSSPQAGTRFAVRLPACEAEASSGRK